ncbi:hypothetical protein [Mucilaginibacter celer]|uniref:Uncharacterized protein n=1 Tax=Mucilaginibacter celer TaxID=2305508 RepID=A0A494VPF4_9SPHI|nr:hypothetical protein [Mucilaginibacter celer]AYL97356.1 hypothetical protein HYN43_019475 [Mucilaginibacter celer]
MQLQVEKRRADLAEFYNLGGTVILILDTVPLWEFYNSIAGHKHINLMDILCMEELPLQYSPKTAQVYVELRRQQPC